MAFNMIITGIGGQGVVSAGTIIAEAALADGLSIRNSDATGLAQRGGSVHSQIKIGANVKSTILHPGTADVILGFEPLEASRYAHLLKSLGASDLDNAISLFREAMQLAEADVPYDQLLEMDDINPRMENVDVAIVIGANDVVNPAARENEGSPIYGMPVINVDSARTVFVLKRSMASGFAGIENPLFYKDNTRMLFGDAKESIGGLIREFN